MSVSYNMMTEDGRVIVRLNDRTVGHIRPHDGGFIYIPKGMSLKRVVSETKPVSLPLLKSRLSAE